MLRSIRKSAGTYRNLLEGSSLRARFVRGATWSFLGSAISQGLGLISAVVTARLLGREGFGAFGVTQSTVGMFGAFAGLGLGMTATKYVAEFRTADPKKAGRIIGLSLWISGALALLGAVILFLFAPRLAAGTLNAPYLVAELRIASGLLLLNTVIGVQAGALTGLEAFQAIARVNLWRGAVSVVAVVIGTVFWQLPGAVWGSVIAAGACCLISHAALRRACAIGPVAIHYRGSLAEWRILRDFSIPAFLGQIIVGPVIWIGNAFLVNQRGGYAEMGVFNAAMQWRTAMMFIPGVLGQLALPLLANLNGAKDRHSYKKVFWVNLAMIVAVVLAAAIPISLASPWIMAMYGPGFAAGWPVLVLLAATTVLSAGCGVVGLAIISAGNMWSGFGLNLLWAISFLLIAKWGVANWGAIGLSGALLCSYVIHALSVIAYTLTVVFKGPGFSPQPEVSGTLA